MNQEALEIYTKLVYEYYFILQLFYQKIEQIAKPKNTSYGGIYFTPTETTITRQIQQWPQHLFLFSPASWVEPRKGEYIYQGALWSYAFHGGGLSFFLAPSERDVSGEFSRNGSLGITEYTTQCYISDKATNMPRLQEILVHHDLYFHKLAAQNIIYLVPSFFDGDDEVYIVTKNT